MRTSGLLSDSTGIIQRVKTVLVGERPLELEAYLERRHALGQDRFDEIWEGTYHVAPMAHPWHGYVDSQIGELLAPVVDIGRADL